MQQVTAAKMSEDSLMVENRPNPVLVTQQIEGLRAVIRRLRIAQTRSVDSLTNEKLEMIKNRYAM